jgi:hypothetical protein
VNPWGELALESAAWLTAVAALTVASRRAWLRVVLTLAFGATAGIAVELGLASGQDLAVGFVTGAVAVAACRRLSTRPAEVEPAGVSA